MTLPIHRTPRRAALVPYLPPVLLVLSLAVGAVRGAEPGDAQSLLAARCAGCHGRGKAEGGFSVVDRAALGAKLASGRTGVVPGRPDASEMYRRVTSTDPDERMPPKGEPLTAAETGLIRDWIAAGAPWRTPWAYQPLRRAPVADLAPSARARAHGPIDRRVEAELSVRGLEPVEPAERRVWLRRVAFDLTGLPPTIEQLAEFQQDSAPDAETRVVERLLASPRLGERWARHWMDVVHYAETHGHDQDRPRPNAWPYRDYLIRAFNRDRPYDRFVLEQVAGDVLAPLDPDAIVATGFLATGPWDESSLRDIRDDTLDRQIARYLDRDDIVSTTFGTFASTTVHCARCHDHKFDPVTQADYYRLQAVFAATDKAEREYDADEETARRRATWEGELAGLDGRRAARDPRLLGPETSAAVAAWEARRANLRDRWTVLTPTDVKSSGGAKLVVQPDGSVLSTGPRPEKDTVVVTGRATAPKLTGLRLEVLVDPSLPHQGPGRQDNGNLHLSEIVVTARPADQPTETPRTIELRNPKADFDQQGWTIAHALDRNPATAWGVFPQVGKPHRAAFEFAQPLDASAGVELTVELQQLHGGGHLIGRARLAFTSVDLPLPLDADVLPESIASILAVPAASRTPDQRLDLAAYVERQRLEEGLRALPPKRLVYAGTSRFKPDGSFRPADGPRPVHVLARGDIRQPGAEATPGAPQLFAELPGELAIVDPRQEGQRRAALARWLVDSRNSLAWRSIVNRIWQYHFGRGIVDTPNDFGAMGGRPSHPELLDELALELQRRDGSLKWLHREIVLSAAFGRASTPAARGEELDADNRWLARMHRSRLDAESLRDALLVLAETLDGTMGGPSDQQFVLSPGVHVTPVVDYQKFDPANRANYRRSVYRFVFRTLPDPFLEALDCVDASQWTPTRNVSITALGALALLNDKFVVRQCEHWAERLEAAEPTVDGQVRRLVRTALLREPTDDERRALAAYVERHGLENACRWIVNSNEFVFVD